MNELAPDVAHERPPVALRAGDLARVASRSFQLQALLSPERMQGLGFGFAILPVIRRLYHDPASRGDALKRHLRYFATHPVLSGFVLGSAARLEERRANGAPVTDDAIDSYKRALASPLAALGDPLFWVTLRPLAGLLGVLAVALLPRPATGEPDLRALLCPLVLVLTYNAVALPYRWIGVSRGYEHADRPDVLLRSLRLPELTTFLEGAGAFVFGSLLVLLAAGLDVASSAWGRQAGGRMLEAAPLLLGALIGFVGMRRWPSRSVEVGLAALFAGALLAAWALIP
jgi:PTS system mannose-specific IID component